MKSKRFLNRFYITMVGNVIRFGLIIAATLLITLLTMMMLTTIGTVFELVMPYKQITALVGIIAFIVITVLTLFGMYPKTKTA